MAALRAGRSSPSHPQKRRPRRGAAACTRGPRARLWVASAFISRFRRDRAGVARTLPRPLAARLARAICRTGIGGAHPRWRRAVEGLDYRSGRAATLRTQATCDGEQRHATAIPCQADRARSRPTGCYHQRNHGRFQAQAPRAVAQGPVMRPKLWHALPSTATNPAPSLSAHRANAGNCPWKGSHPLANLRWQHDRPSGSRVCTQQRL